MSIGFLFSVSLAWQMPNLGWVHLHVSLCTPTPHTSEVSWRNHMTWPWALFQLCVIGLWSLTAVQRHCRVSLVIFPFTHQSKYFIYSPFFSDNSLQIIHFSEFVLISVFQARSSALWGWGLVCFAHSYLLGPCILLEWALNKYSGNWVNEWMMLYDK